MTYDIIIESFPGSAFSNLDYFAAAEIDEDFSPNQQRIPVNFVILPDDAPEGIEMFTFQLRNNDQEITFTNDPRETTISIFDTDSECCSSQAIRGRPQCMCSKRQCMEVELCRVLSGSAVHALLYRYAY